MKSLVKPINSYTEMARGRFGVGVRSTSGVPMIRGRGAEIS